MQLVPSPLPNSPAAAVGHFFSSPICIFQHHTYMLTEISILGSFPCQSVCRSTITGIYPVGQILCWCGRSL